MSESKILKIDFSDDRLVAIAVDMIDNHNYIGALKMLNKNAELAGNDDETLSLYAEIYDDLGLYERCINGWFKYLDATDSEDLTDCYEGLAVSFMNIGNQQYSAYYYNSLLRETEFMDPALREEIIRDFLSVDENPLKFAYPPKLADTSEIFKRGIEFMKNGEYEKAEEVFSDVDEENEKYTSARNYIAMCKIISERADEAEQECLNILKKHPDNVQALTTLSAVKSDAGKKEEAAALAEKLLSLDVEDTDDIYKIATVCCENKMHDSAYKLFNRLAGSGELAYDLSVMFFRAVSAFNSGRREKSLEIFDDIITVYPEAVTAKLFYDRARHLTESGKPDELSYFYRLPQELQEATLKLLYSVMEFPAKSEMRLSSEMNLSACIDWCFEAGENIESESTSELKRLAVHVAINACLDEKVREILLNAFLSDRLKLEMLTLLGERNEFNTFGVVLCNIYRRVTLQIVQVGRLKRKMFIRAVAKLVANFSVIDDGYGEQFVITAQNLYYKLEAEGRLKDLKNANALTALIYMQAKIRNKALKDEAVLAFFNVTEKDIKKITG